MMKSSAVPWKPSSSEAGKAFLVNKFPPMLAGIGRFSPSSPQRNKFKSRQALFKLFSPWRNLHCFLKLVFLLPLTSAPPAFVTCYLNVQEFDAAFQRKISHSYPLVAHSRSMNRKLEPNDRDAPTVASVMT